MSRIRTARSARCCGSRVRSVLVLTGAHTLAAELAAAPADPPSAFASYETKHRALVDPRQGNITMAAALMVPATRPGIAARNLASRLWPAAATTGWLRNRITPRRDPAPRRSDQRPAAGPDEAER